MSNQLNALIKAVFTQTPYDKHVVYGMRGLFLTAHALAASGLSPHYFSGTGLVADVTRARRPATNPVPAAKPDLQR